MVTSNITEDTPPKRLSSKIGYSPVHDPHAEFQISMKIALHGSFHLDNFGDTLLGLIFVKWIKKHTDRIACPGAHPTVLAQFGIPNDFAYSDADAVVFAGGGYFGEPPVSFPDSWRWNARWFYRHGFSAQTILRQNIPHCVLGVGFGPLSNLLTRRTACRLLQSAKIATVRDEESFYYFQQYAPDVNIKVTADAAFTLYQDSLHCRRRTELTDVRTIANGRDIILLHLNKTVLINERWDIFIRGLRKWLTTRSNALIVGIDDQMAPTNPALRKNFEDGFHDFKNRIFLGYNHAAELVHIIEQASLVVTTKLHVGIVALALQRPVLAFPSHTKTPRTYRQIGMDARCLPVAEWSYEKIVRFLRTNECLIGDKVTLPEKVRQDAESNQLYLDRFIDGVARPDPSGRCVGRRP